MNGGLKMEKRVFTIDEVAELLCVSKSYIYQLVRENKIPNLKLGKRKLIGIKLLFLYIENGGMEKELVLDRVRLVCV